MSIANLCRQGETSPKNKYKFSGKAYTDYLSYDLEYDYNPDYAHRLNKIGRYYYQYDSNGNITAYSPTSFEPEYDIKIVQVNDKEWYLNYNILEGPALKKRTPSWQRTIFYDDRNQMCEVSDFNSGKQTAYYHYDEDGKRTSKLIWNLQEVLSFGELFSLWLKPSNKWELGQTQKSIMLGQTRLVSKIDSATKGSIRRWKDEHTFYYLSDRIGTANFITTYEGEIYQITEYTPYGERWIERTQNKYNEFYLPYRFAGKPLDEETGWYYFGARYYDPKYQIWTTSDPALTDYFSDSQKGEGGVFNHINLNTYHYAGNNPIKYVDPDGRADFVSNMMEDYHSDPVNFDAQQWHTDLYLNEMDNFCEYMATEGGKGLAKGLLDVGSKGAEGVAIFAFAVGHPEVGVPASWISTGLGSLLNLWNASDNGENMWIATGKEAINFGATYLVQEGTGKLAKATAKKIFSLETLPETTQRILNVTKEIEGVFIPKVVE